VRTLVDEELEALLQEQDGARLEPIMEEDTVGSPRV